MKNINIKIINKMKKEEKNTEEATTKALSKTNVSGSFSVDEVKWLIFYGENKEKNFDLKTEDKGELDYAITQMFLMMKESSRFDMDRVEKVFWERVTALANYR